MNQKTTSGFGTVSTKDTFVGETETVIGDQAFYDRRWNTSYVTTEREYNRIFATIRAIPGDCQSILDVGTGAGLLANEMIATGKAVTAVDISKVALSRVKGPTLLRSADNLAGVPNRSYDLVLCTETLEHLDDATYRGALGEFNRVARRAILITVPNRELMREHMGLCGDCGCRFHIWGHRRRFTQDDLKPLFPDFRADSVTEFGDQLPKYNRPLLWLRTAIARAWFVDERSPCPECHSYEAAKPKYPLVARLCDFMNSNLPKIRTEPWLMAIYRIRPEINA